MGVIATVPILPELRLTNRALMRPTPKQAPRVLSDRGGDKTVDFRP